MTYRFSHIEEWPLSHWRPIPDNPRQRDTARHAQNPRSTHLRRDDPAHHKVTVGRLPDGTMMKIDGHSRLFCWDNQIITPAPAKLFIEVWNLDTPYDGELLYERMDNALAAETSGDKVYGAFRRLGYTPISEMFKRAQITKALRVAHTVLGKGVAGGGQKGDLFDLIEHWLPELQAFDACRPTSHVYRRGSAAAAMLSFRAYGQKVAPFWVKYGSNQGERQGVKMDAVQAVHEALDTRKPKQNEPGILYDAAVCLSAIEAYFDDRWYQTRVRGSGVRPLNIQTWAAQVMARQDKIVSRRGQIPAETEIRRAIRG